MVNLNSVSYSFEMGLNIKIITVTTYELVQVVSVWASHQKVKTMLLNKINLRAKVKLCNKYKTILNLLNWDLQLKMNLFDLEIDFPFHHSYRNKRLASRAQTNLNF